MGLRNARAYSKRYARPYTRTSKVKSKAYIKTVPHNKIVKCMMGNVNGYQKGQLKLILRLICKREIQLRDNAIEACRQGILKELDNNSVTNYYFAVRRYPHHILRENRMFSGGSKGERVNQGMQQSFGSSIGRAALVKEGEDIFLVAVSDKKFLPIIRNAFRKVGPKLACATKVSLEEKK